MRFKIFSSHDIIELESEVNGFLKTNDFIIVLSQSLSVTPFTQYVPSSQPSIVNDTWLEYTIMITY